MSNYSLTKTRTFQWILIILVLAAVAGGYFYFRSKAAVKFPGKTVTYLTSGTSWTVPSDWNSTSNTIEAIGGGGGGADNAGHAGGGGGAYAVARNVTLTPGASISYAVGTGGTTNVAGGDTTFNTSTVISKGGSAGSGATGGAGGAAGSSTPTTGAFSGGRGGDGDIGGCADGGGGGGAASKLGAGARGGDGNGNSGGGGGSGGGSAGSSGAGGANDIGAGAGSFPAGNGSSSLTHSAGGGGGEGNGGATGGTGGSGQEWDSTHGSGGGGGGGGSQCGSPGSNGGNGGLYGGGGGGTGYWNGGSSAGTGGQGIIIVTYTPRTTKLSASPNSSITSGLVGHWTFDGADVPWTSSTAATATDRSGQSNTGTLTNMSQSTSPVPGRVGQGLLFDGSNDYVSVAHNTVLNPATNSFTTSAWVNVASLPSAGFYPAFVAKVDNDFDNGYALNVNTDTSKFRFMVDILGGPAYDASSNTTITTNTWYFITGVLDRVTNKVKIYVNGVFEAEVAGPGATTINPTAALELGRYNRISLSRYEYINAKIDDVRIYNRALSAAEIQSLYQMGGANVNTGASLPQGIGRLDSALSGYWKFDDGSGTTPVDSSTGGNNGSFGDSPTWTTGQINGALSFDGANDYVRMAANAVAPVKDVTIAAWVKPSSGIAVYATIAERTYASTHASPFHVFKIGANYASSGKFSAELSTGGSVTNIDGTTSYSLGVWYFVMLTYDGTTMRLYVNGVQENSSTARSGNLSYGSNGALVISANADSGERFAGTIDEVRVYTRALSADEVKKLYQLTTPTGTDTSLKGYWSFDGGATKWTSSTAGTVIDLSGANNTGTLTNMSQSTSPTPGKIGQGLLFDGTDDYVSVAGSPSVQNISYWIKPNTSTYSKYSVGLSTSRRYLLNNGLYSGTNTATPYINGVAATAESLGSEMITDGTAESGGTGYWQSYFESPASGTLTVTSSSPYAGTYSFSMNISVDGPSIQFYDPGYLFSTTAGQLYKAQFAIKGSTNFTGLTASILLNNSPWTATSPGYTFDVTTSWALHTYYFYAQRSGTSDTRFDLFLNGSGTGNIYIDNASLKPVNSVGDVTNNAWNFVSVNLDSAVSANSINLGFGSGYLKGILDDVRIYNTALSATEITNLYNLGR